MANNYPPCEAQVLKPSLLTMPALPPKRTAREIAEERWGLSAKGAKGAINNPLRYCPFSLISVHDGKDT
jgi:hypothetical protein